MGMSLGVIDMEEEKKEQEDVKQEVQQEPMDVEKEKQEHEEGQVKQEPVKAEKEVKKGEEPRNNRKRNFLIVLFVLFIWWCVSTIDERFDNLEERITNASMNSAYINNEDIVSEVRSVLKEQASVLASTDWNMRMLDKKIKKVELTMSAVPKEYIEGMEVIFYADCSDGTKVSVKGKQIEDMKFTGKVEIPLCESVNMRVSLKKGDVNQIQEIGSDSVRERFVLNLNGDWTGQCGYRGGVVNMDGRVSVELNGYEDRYEQRSNTMKKLDVVLYVANKEWKRLPVEMEQNEALFNDVSYYREVKETIPLEAKEEGIVGETFKMTIEGEDINGFHYRRIVFQTRFKENGECVDTWQVQPETEVY